jgi:polyisoprenoid-binding protein YceI
VKQSPLITFLSKKVVQTGPDAFEVQGGLYDTRSDQTGKVDANAFR